MESRDSGGRQRLGDEIAALMGELVRDFRAGFVGCADQLGLGPGEAQALWLLSGGDDISTGDLARRLGVDPANASTLLTKLEGRGYVRRDPAPNDRRKRLASLTAEGRQAKLMLARCMERRQVGFAALTIAELRSFRDLLRRVAARG